LLRVCLPVGVLVVAGCSEDEQACYQKLSADFDEYAVTSVEAAKGKSLDDQIAAGELAVTARESALSILVIYNDDDRSACDYVSAGPYLQRK
jgi:hypothetical protein